MNTLLESVKTITGLTHLTFSTEGTKNKDIAAISLAKILGELVNLEELSLNFTLSDLHCQGAAALAEATS